MNIVKKIVHFLASISYIFIGVYVIICIPMVLKWKPVVVLTGSMEPTYDVGSVIYYKKVPKEEIKQGDVITFTLKDNTFVTHRVNKVEDNDMYETKGDANTFVTHRVNKVEDNDMYETKGDANESPDIDKVSYDNIKGKVQKLYIPYVGYYINFIGHNMYLIAIVIIILVSEFLLSNIKTSDIKRKKEDSSEE